MQQLFSSWQSLDLRRKTVVALATLAMFSAVLMLGRLATTPSLVLLYSGLESSTAGEVVRALEQRGVAYEVRGGAIYVETGQRDELRMTLASEGLPASGSRGYELLDSLSGFGTTSQMFDAAYWRAKEGELARTITASPHISAARVHIANTGSNPFQRDVKLSASVSVTSAGQTLSGPQVHALKHLVSSAVAGLDPAQVDVIDGSGGLLQSGDDGPQESAGEARADALRAKVQRLLEARVGRGNVVVEVSLDAVLESERIRERSFDPESRVAISVDTEERATSSRGRAGAVTVASNLPDGEAGGSEDSSNDTETRERINYEVSETEREIVREPGAIRRLTVAVLVNGVPDQTQADTPETLVPRPDSELTALHDLVASAVGYDEARGDVITLKSMPFEPGAVLGTAPTAEGFKFSGLDIGSLFQSAVLALVALVLGLFVLRPLFLQAPAEIGAPIERALPPVDLPSPSSQTNEESSESRDLPPLTGMIDDGNGEFLDGTLHMEASQATSADLPALPDAAEDDPVLRLRNMIDSRREETVEILRNWMEDETEETA